MDDATMVYMIGRINQGIRREMRTRLSPWKLSVAEYTTLSVLKARPRLSNAQLARRALVTPQSMIEILAALERRGLVQRALGPEHGRILRASLTAEGLELLRGARASVGALDDELMAGVPDEQRAAAMAALRVAMRNLAQPPSSQSSHAPRRAA
jgi:DNA-binding MarR family transcriptional regulator